MRISWMKVALVALMLVFATSAVGAAATRKDGRPKGTRPGAERRVRTTDYRDRDARVIKDRVGSIGPAAEPADQTIIDDLIVVGSACLGFDCITNEAFGLENLKLKQNNNRILFDDTSASAGFPSNDWALTANDDNSGGQNRFSITDVTAGRTPFSVQAGARTDALVVASTGRIGIGTAGPTQTIHAVTGDTPGLRLEQDGSSGFTARTWDVAANESNFFVRDVTGGNVLPFRIRPGAPSSSLDILGSGDVGLGTGAPATALHLFSSASARVIRMETSGGTVPSRWDIGNRPDGAFKIDSAADGQYELLVSDQGMLRTRPRPTPPNKNTGRGSLYTDSSGEGAFCWYSGTEWFKVAGNGSCK